MLGLARTDRAAVKHASVRFARPSKMLGQLSVDRSIGAGSKSKTQSKADITFYLNQKLHEGEAKSQNQNESETETSDHMTEA